MLTYSVNMEHMKIAISFRPTSCKILGVQSAITINMIQTRLRLVMYQFILNVRFPSPKNLELDRAVLWLMSTQQRTIVAGRLFGLFNILGGLIYNMCPFGKGSRTCSIGMKCILDYMVEMNKNGIIWAEL